MEGAGCRAAVVDRAPVGMSPLLLGVVCLGDIEVQRWGEWYDAPACPSQSLLGVSTISLLIRFGLCPVRRSRCPHLGLYCRLALRPAHPPHRRLHLLSSPSRHLQPIMPLSSSTVSSYCPSSVIHGYTPHCPLSTVYQSIICVILVTRAVPVHLHLAAALRRFLLFVYYLAYELFYNPLSRLGHGVLVSLGTHGLEL